MAEPSKPHDEGPPTSSILIIGAGVFGISTALTLLKSTHYNHTQITIVDAYAPGPESGHALAGRLGRNEITASLDTSRIVRPDYPDPRYAKLADDAIGLFRAGCAEISGPDAGAGAGPDAPERTYTQPGFVLITLGPKDGRSRVYLQKTYENTLQLARAARSHGSESNNSSVEPVLLPSSQDVDTQLHCAPGSLPESVTGYINPQAGWANASAAIAAIKQQVLALGRARESERKAQFRFLSGCKVISLLFTDGSDNKRRVTGAKLSTGEQLQASMTILATGAWTVPLLPSLFAPRLHASGQVLTYISLTSVEEVARYAGRPTIMDMEDGMFIIFPPEHYKAEKRTTAHVKVARHGWGYAHTRKIVDPTTSHEVECFIPTDAHEDFFTIPAEGRKACRKFTQLLLPELSEREFILERTCWYTDTPTGDFLVDFIPELDGVLMATGGSGHGFKFLPVIGEKIVARLEGRLDEGLAELWRWRGTEDCERLWKGEGDTSRGGRRGMSWEEEIAR